jgi:hypothetical protein
MAIRCPNCRYELADSGVVEPMVPTPWWRISLIAKSVCVGALLLIAGVVYGVRHGQGNELVGYLIAAAVLYGYFLSYLLSGYVDLRGAYVNDVYSRRKSKTDFWFQTIAVLIGAIACVVIALLHLFGVVDFIGRI